MYMKRCLAGSWVVALVALFDVGAFAVDAMPQTRIWQDAITLQTYPWYDDPNPVFPEFESHIYYPYTRQDQLSTEAAPKTYRTICLENEYLRLICIPELGGRIHSVLDKTTGDEMFHLNEVIKPALIAMRGAWIAGGIEWNPGPHGHTVTIVSPVDVTSVTNGDGSVTLVVGNTEKMFRTRWTVRLTLHPGKAYLDESISMYNPTDGVHPYYFWNNTAFPNLEGTHFVYPMTLGTDHAGTSFYHWPVNNDIDLTKLVNYPTMSSIFAYQCVFDFFGAYDVNRDRGIVSYANHQIVRGKKAWTWGKDDFAVYSQSSLSDSGPVNCQYIEVQSGPLLTQADYGMLRPHQKVEWREFWYPVHGLGGPFEYATRDAAVRVELSPSAGNNRQTATVHLLATARFDQARLVLSKSGAVLAERVLDLDPAKAQDVAFEDLLAGPLDLSLADKDGQTLLEFTSPLPIPAVEAPDLTVKPARADGQPTADELYEKAWLADSQSNPAQARAGYEEVLVQDPKHAKALSALATLDLEQGLFEQAEEHARLALDRDPAARDASYTLASALYRLGRYEESVDAAYAVVNSLADAGAGYYLAGRALLRLGETKAARHALEKAVEKSLGDATTRDTLLIARYLDGERAALLPVLTRLTDQDDPTDYVGQALRALVSPGGPGAFGPALAASAGEYEFNALETSVFFAELGLYPEAHDLLNAARNAESTPLADYDLAYYAQQAGLDKAAREHLRNARKGDYKRVFPSRVEDLEVLEFAVARQPMDAVAQLLLGHCLAGLRRSEEAASHWREAVRLNRGLSEGWRSLALYAEHKEKRTDEAIRLYRSAIQAARHDDLLYTEIAPLMEKQGKQPEAIALIEKARLGDAPRYDVVLWLAESYLKEGRYDDCLKTLMAHEISTWEGQTKPHDIFADALVKRGKGYFEAGLMDAALKDFEQALTYPENLGVGARYELTDAEPRYWMGQTLQGLGRKDEARAAYEIGSKQLTSAAPPKPSISIPAGQDEYVKKCQEALAAGA